MKAGGPRAGALRLRAIAAIVSRACSKDSFSYISTIRASGAAHPTGDASTLASQNPQEA